jgi:phosphoserine aminotransferase
MARIFNFSAGPAVMPEEVLAQARDELLDWHGSGMSVMEMSHRSKSSSRSLPRRADLQALLGILELQVLFLQGGAQAQFASCR